VRAFIFKAPLALSLGLLGLGACSKDQEPPVEAKEARKPAVVSPEIAAAYKPGPDPLAALYGRGASAPKGEEAFKLTPERPPEAPMPSAWRSAYQKLKGRSGLQVKLSAWSITTRSRLDQREPDQELSWTLHLLGERAAIWSALKAVVAPQRAYRGLQPAAQASAVASLKHSAERGPYRLALEAKKHWGEGERLYLTVELSWARLAPAPASSSELRNCRYLKGLTPPSEAERAPWLGSIFKTNSKRRFAEWSYQLGDPEAPRWTGLWVYRNGSLRDKGVKWWSDTLSAHGGERLEMQGMEQRWRLPEGRAVTWWSETDPSELGCLLEAPLLSVSWSEPSRP